MGVESVIDLCRQLDVLALYLFGSRADDGQKVLAGQPVSREGSDLDVGVILENPGKARRRLARLQVVLEDVFTPLRVDLVPLDRVDALLQFAAIDGHRVAATDADRVDRYELDVMRRAAELLPIERRIEHDKFGVATA